MVKIRHDFESVSLKDIKLDTKGGVKYNIIKGVNKSKTVEVKDKANAKIDCI